MTRYNRRRIKTSDGFTLVEVLVALLIVALGMLGNAMLQLQGMKNSNDAYMRSQIGIFAYDIADKIRANRECQNQYLTQGTLTLGSPYIVGTTARGACVHTNALGAAGMANEVNCIAQMMDSGLPAGSQVSLASNAVTPAGASRAVTLFTLRITWTDRDGQVQNVDYTFDPGACTNAAACQC